MSAGDSGGTFARNVVPPTARLRLPNGMQIVPQSRTEAEHFYDDLFVKRVYLRHGVTVSAGDCVFDVGGNIGLFALYVHRHAPGARVYTFEPAPPLYRLLRTNLALNGAAARIFHFGIADTERTARFTFYPNSSGMSSFHADAGEEREVLRAMMQRQRTERVEGMEALLEYTEELLDERFRAVEMECRLRPLSAVIREQGVRRIDLLKIDVQKSEMEVLRGIVDEDWPRIRQIVMEVHDLNGRLAEVVQLLERRGFGVAVEQDEAVGGSVLYNVFAVSRAASRPGHHPPPTPAIPDAADPAADPDGAPSPAFAGWHLLLLSAPSPEALDAATRRLARHLAANPALPLADVAFTLRRQCGGFSHRRAVVVGEGEDAPSLLLARDPVRTAEGVVDASGRTVAFLFPGLGDLYPGMARGLYHSQPIFRAEVDRCVERLHPLLGFDLREPLFAAPREPSPESSGGVDLRRMLRRAPASESAALLHRTEVAQPAAFVLGYALARLWESWGVRPDVVAGHSLGEYTAACVAGIFSPEDALELVALRARAIQALPTGAMLAVSLSRADVAPWLNAEVTLAAVNAPELSVLSGTEEAIARTERALARAGHAVRRLGTTHAFHSPLMHPVAGQVVALAGGYGLSAPHIPMLSNMTGTWLTGQQATDPSYWAQHLVGTVQFARGAEALLALPNCVLLEMGPGGSLGAFVRQQAAASGSTAPESLTALPHAADGIPEPAFLLSALGRLWTTGVRLDECAFAPHAGHPVPLPTMTDAPSPAPAGGDGIGVSVASRAGEEEGGEVARVLAGVWQELLGVEAGLHDDFFQLGGHSLVATRLIAKVRERFGVEMRLRTLFQNRTVFQMARWIEDALAA